MNNLNNIIIKDILEIEEEDAESVFFKKERDEYLNLNKNFDIEPEYAFKCASADIILSRPIDDNKKLIEENFLLRKRIEELEIKLKKYTNGENHKRYYEKNKLKIKQDGLTYLKNLKLENPEKIKEYNHKAYLKKKEKQKLKLQQLSETNDIIERLSESE